MLNNKWEVITTDYHSVRNELLEGGKEGWANEIKHKSGGTMWFHL